MDLTPVVSQKYITGTMGDTFARATRRENRIHRKIPEKKTSRLRLGRGGGVERERFSIRARSGVGGVSSSNWIICIQVTNVSFLHGAITRMAAGKRRGERGGRERSPVGAGTYASEPIGSNVHFSFSPSAIGGTVWDPHSEQSVMA
jgi:hypothetical protein